MDFVKHSQKLFRKKKQLFHFTIMVLYRTRHKTNLKKARDKQQEFLRAICMECELDDRHIDIERMVLLQASLPRDSPET